MGSDEMLQGPDGGASELAGSNEARVTSKHRGLYYDRKHGSWRVRIFYLGRQRHIGRYKDETQAAQAYDRAAYFLYGTRANLNFRLKDVLADTQDVPASIRQAKEQSMPAHLPRHTPATASSSSSTYSCSPHHSAQSLHGVTHSAAGMVRVGSGQSQFTATGSVLHHPVLQHQQQQYYAACGFQQQQLPPQPQVLLPGPGNASPSYSSSTAWMPTEQQMQPRAYGQPAAAAAVRYDPAWQQQQHQHQQQSLVALQQQQQQQLAALQQQQQPGVYVPDVVASVIAALGLPSHAASQAASSSSSSSSSSTWAGSNTTALAPLAGTAAAVIGGPGNAVLAAAGAAGSSPACMPFSGPLPLSTSHGTTALLPAEYASQLQAVAYPDGLRAGGSGLGGIHWTISSSHAGQMGSHGALGAMQQQQHRLAPASYSVMPQASLPVAAVPPQAMAHLMGPNHHHHHQQQQMQLQMQLQSQQGHGGSHGSQVLLNLPSAQQVPVSATQPCAAGGLLASMSSVEGPGGVVLAGNQLSVPSNMA